MNPSLLRIEQLQAWRGRRIGDPSIAGTVLSLASETSRLQRLLGDITDLWLQLVPPEIVAHTALTALRGGVLHVTADSAAVSFQLDRALRAGLETELRRHYRGTLLRVRLRVQPLENPTTGGATSAQRRGQQSRAPSGGRRTPSVRQRMSCAPGAPSTRSRRSRGR